LSLAIEYNNPSKKDHYLGDPDLQVYWKKRWFRAICAIFGLMP
jgi:hypothetical protein